MSRVPRSSSAPVHGPRSHRAGRRRFAPGIWRFVGLNILMWLVMTAILLVLPDQIDRWMDLTVARAVAWGVAGAVWVVAIERQWQSRMGALARFPWQVLLWVSSALVAMWLSDQFRL